MPRVAPDYIYLDYAATAPLCEEAAQAMAPYFQPGRANLAVGANANSLHSPGRAAFAAMEDARRSLARDVGARRPDEVIFTAGATEADNMAVAGIARAEAARRRRSGAGATFVPHVITTAIEHEAVLAPVRALEADGFLVTRLAPNRRGFIEPEALRAALRPETVLVSVQAANSELGSVQSITELAAVANEAGALFHTDAVQALGKIPLSVDELGVDAASFAAHKVGGPKGVGALYLRARTPFAPTALGGGQEAGRRSGTQNVAGIVGFAAAAHAACQMQQAEAERLLELRDGLYAQLGKLPGVRATIAVEPGSLEYLPNIVHVLVEGFESETLILRLDQQGMCVSGGSACSSHSLDPSHVLTAVGVPASSALGALRVSLGRYTTQADVDAFVAALPECLR